MTKLTQDSRFAEAMATVLPAMRAQRAAAYSLIDADDTYVHSFKNGFFMAVRPNGEWYVTIHIAQAAAVNRTEKRFFTNGAYERSVVEPVSVAAKRELKRLTEALTSLERQAALSESLGG